MILTSGGQKIILDIEIIIILILIVLGGLQDWWIILAEVF